MVVEVDLPSRTTSIAAEDTQYPNWALGNAYLINTSWEVHGMKEDATFNGNGKPGTKLPSYYYAVLWASGYYWKSEYASCCQETWTSSQCTWRAYYQECAKPQPW